MMRRASTIVYGKEAAVLSNQIQEIFMRQDQESIHEESSLKSSYRTDSDISGSMQPESEANLLPGSSKDLAEPKVEE